MNRLISLLNEYSMLIKFSKIMIINVKSCYLCFLYDNVKNNVASNFRELMKRLVKNVQNGFLLAKVNLKKLFQFKNDIIRLIPFIFSYISNEMLSRL